MNGEEWRASRNLIRVKLRQTRSRLGKLRPAIFYAFVITAFVCAYVATTQPGHEAHQRGYSAATDKGTQTPVVGDDPNERIAQYTLGLEWFTGALAIFSAIEIFVLVRTEDGMRRSIEIARRQMLLTGLQADIINKQQAVGRQEYFATHRPKLVVREVVMTERTPYVKIQFAVANVGASDAAVVESAAVFWHGSAALLRVRDIPAAQEIGAVTIASGDRHTHEITSDIQGFGLFLAAGELDARFWDRADPFVFRGYIIYQDPITEIRRRTAFWRVYNASAQRFGAVDDPDFEYAD